MPRRSSQQPKPAAAPPPVGEVPAPEYATVPMSSVIPPRKPMRVAMDEDKMAELCDSIRTVGLIHPVAVFPVGDKFEVGAGHRRYVAHTRIGAVSIKVHIYRDEDSLVHAVMLHENTVREDITAAEEGQQFIELAEEQGWSIDQLCQFFHRSEQYINARATLVADFKDVAEHVYTREITWSQAETLMREKKPERRAYLIDQAVNAGASKRQLITMIDQFKQQDRLIATVGQPAPAEQVYHVPEVPVPVCVWCGRDDDQGNIDLIPVHRYHKRDLEVFLDQAGTLRPLPQGNGNEQ